MKEKNYSGKFKPEYSGKALSPLTEKVAPAKRRLTKDGRQFYHPNGTILLALQRQCKVKPTTAFSTGRRQVDHTTVNGYVLVCE